jgi:hypothetical protein
LINEDVETRSVRLRFGTDCRTVHVPVLGLENRHGIGGAPSASGKQERQAGECQCPDCPNHDTSAQFTDERKLRRAFPYNPYGGSCIAGFVGKQVAVVVRMVLWRLCRKAARVRRLDRDERAFDDSRPEKGGG